MTQRITVKELTGLTEDMRVFVGLLSLMLRPLASTMLSMVKDGWLFHKKEYAASAVIVLMDVVF